MALRNSKYILHQKYMALAQCDLLGIFQDTESPVGEHKTNFKGSKTTKEDLNLKDMKVEEIPNNTNKQEFILQDFMQVLHVVSFKLLARARIVCNIVCVQMQGRIYRENCVAKINFYLN
jgi:hypothetical protein